MTNWNQLQSEDKPIVVFPTAYFPPISYLVFAKQYDQVAIDGGEHYIKQSIRNRANILSANGVLSLSVPVSRDKTTRLTSGNIKIDYHTSWQQNHLRAIRSAYGKTPYFDYYFPDLETIILSSPKNLIELNKKIINYLFEKMRIKTQILETTEYVTEPLEDYRNAFTKDSNIFNKKNKPYFQAFCNKYPFIEDLSCMDLLFNMGSESSDYLQFV
ncbi:MAG: WbqC family protein [Bacteroidales bacterium]|jgi:hypothetical protein|nr:WbqC family protein [Bacteroidales bacterium]